MDFQTKLQPQPLCYCHSPNYTRQPPKYIYPCLTCIFIILIILLVVLLAGPSILISIYQPSIPTINVASVEVSGLNISPTSTRITGDATIKFSISNPNKKTIIFYENVQVCIYYKRHLLKCTHIQSFHQASQTQKVMIARLHAKDKLKDSYTLLEMGKELISTGGLKGFRARLITRTWFNPGSSGILGWGWQNMWALCENVSVRFSANRRDGTLSSGPHECSVSLSF